jgi:flagellar basal body-associated protein FliL
LGKNFLEVKQNLRCFTKERRLKMAKAEAKSEARRSKGKKILNKWSIATFVVLGLGILALLMEDKIGASRDNNVVAHELSVEEMDKYSVDIPFIMTNLGSGEPVKIQFNVIATSSKNSEIVKKSIFKIQNIVIKDLILMTKNEFIESSSITTFEKKLKVQINQKIGEDVVAQIYTVSKLVD